ncbi:MAG: hypothetical protein ACTSV7_10565 [Candidatus Baldrarchaeia archaeon]
MNGAFDTNLYPNPYHHTSSQISFGEAILLSNASGIAYVGGARVNYGCLNAYVDKGYLYPEVECYMQGMLTYFFDSYKSGASLGNIAKNAMEKYYTKNGLSCYKDNVTFFEFTLLGDPVLPLPKQPGITYNQPNLTSSNPSSYSDAINFIWGASGEIPVYYLSENETVTVLAKTNSPIVTVKVVNPDKWYDETIETKRLNVSNNISEYSFIPPENALYLIRVGSEDGKEGWLYTFTQVIPENATLYLSAPTTVAEGEYVFIYGEVEPALIMNFSAVITFPNGTQKSLGTTTSDARGRFYFSFSTYGYPSGEYKVTVKGELETLSLEGTIKFRIEDYDEIKIFLLSSKNFNTSNCEQYGFRACKVWPIEMKGMINSTTCGDNCDILKLSKSGKVYNTTINTSNGKRYIAVVDTIYAGIYDMVFIDDDPIFIQSAEQEVNISEKGFLSEGDIAGNIQTAEGEKIDIILAKIARNGSSILLITPPAQDELPYEVNDWVNFIVLALDDGNPKQGISIYPEFHYIGKAYTQLSNSTTDDFGLSQIYSFPVYEPGSYIIEVNDDWFITIKVKPPFDVKYSIKDANTDKEKSVFKPGDKIKFEISAVDRNANSLVPLKNVFIWIIDPEWNFYYVNARDANNDYVYEGTYNLEENASVGTWKVRIEVETEEGVKDEVKTSFEVKTFEVRTFGKGGFAPNESAWILVTAVPLGYSGDYYKMPEFYPIDDPNTTIDECSKDEWGNYRNVIIKWVKDKEGNKLNVSGWNITNVETFLKQIASFSTKSKYLQEFEKHADELPEDFLRQCVIQFNTPTKESIYSGSISVKRADTNEWEQGSFTFSIQTIDAIAYPWDPEKGWRWAFSPGSNVTLKIEAWDLYNDEEIPVANIIDAKIIEIKGSRGAVEILNQSFVKTTEYALLKFIAPNQTGWYDVKFMITTQVNVSGELKNATGIGDGWFLIKLYEVWGYAEKEAYATNESVPLKVYVRDFSGNPVANVKIEIESVMNWKTKEEYVNKTVWKSNITDNDGKTFITLMPNITWSKGWYDVKLKAIDAEGRYEYGYAWFNIRNYIVWVQRLVDGEWKWEILKGKRITFIPLVRKASEKWWEPPLDASKYSINLNESVLNYYGDVWSYKYDPEKIKLTNLNATLWQTSYQGVSVWAINISTNSNLIKPGNYKASIKLSINGEEEVGETWFWITTFETYAKVLQTIYAAGDEVNINVSVKPSSQAFNVTLKELWGCYEWECSKIEINASILSCVDSCIYSFTLPAVKEGWYHGDLEFSVGEEKGYEWIWFEVKNLIIAPPKFVSEYLWQQLTNETWVTNKIASASPCSNIGYNLTLPPEILNNSCTLLQSTLTEGSEKIGIPRSNYWILIDTTTNKVYIDTNRNFTDGNITYNSTIGDSFVDKEGIEWVITDIGHDWLILEAKNALNNGIKVNLSLSKSGKFRFAYFNESEFSNYWEEEKTDLDKDGKLEYIYLLAVDSKEQEVYDKVFIEYNVTDLSTKTPVSEGSQTTIGTTPLYVVEIAKTVNGVKVYLAIPEEASYYPWFGTRKVNTNITFPVLVSYPNGTAIQGANVSIYKIMIKNTETKELLENEINLSKQTDANGIVIFTLNLTESGYYTIIPKARVDSEQALMESWTAPHVEAKAFYVWGNAYSKLAEIDDFEHRTLVKFRTTSFPKEGKKVWLYWNYTEVVPPSGVTDYYAGYTYMGTNQWWLLVDNITGRVYVDDDTFFNETDAGWQNISIGEDFELNWSDWSGRNYSAIFKLLGRPAENEIIFGFELGNYKGTRFVFETGKNKTILANGKQYAISYEKVKFVYQGNYSAGSGKINDNQESWIQTTIVLTSPANLSFYWKVSSESGFDFLKFYINNTKMANISGEIDWICETYSLAPGNYTLRWSYEKDVSISSGLDAGWIDNISIVTANETVFYEDWESGKINLSKWQIGGDANWSINPIFNRLTIIDPQKTEKVLVVEESEWYYVLPLNIYVEEISSTNITLSISIGDLRIANYSRGTMIVLDNITYPNGFDLLGSQSYDTVLLTSTGNLTQAIELHPGDCIQLADSHPYVLSKIDPYGYEIWFLNGTMPILYPPESATDYLIKNVSETNLGVNRTDLNKDGDLEDDFYFVIYDYPWDDSVAYTQMVIDDDNDLLDYWVWNDGYYPIDFRGNETGEKEEWSYLPSDYVSMLDSKIFFNNKTNTLSLLEYKWEFDANESITVWVEAKDFDWMPIQGNLSIIKIKTWDKEFNASTKLITPIVNGYGLITIAPQHFKFNETANLSYWPEDFRIIGKVYANDGREESVAIWVSSTRSEKVEEIGEKTRVQVETFKVG